MSLECRRVVWKTIPRVKENESKETSVPNGMISGTTVRRELHLLRPAWITTINHHQLYEYYIFRETIEIGEVWNLSIFLLHVMPILSCEKVSWNYLYEESLFENVHLILAQKFLLNTCKITQTCTIWNFINQTTDAGNSIVTHLHFGHKI